VRLSQLYTGGVITTLPFIALYLLLQDRFIAGMTQGGIKG
jgi:ABC-type glycerol-3-phosphate transport system permease component